MLYLTTFNYKRSATRRLL